MVFSAHIRRFGTLILFALLGQGYLCAAVGQVAGEEPGALIKEFKVAWKAENLGKAYSALARVVAQAPDQLYHIAEPVDSLLASRASRSVLVVDTLLLVYNSAIAHEKGNRMDWMIRKGLLVLNHKDHYPGLVEPALAAPMREDPLSCPDYLIEGLWEEWLSQAEESQIGAEALALNWSHIDRVLDLRIAEYPEPPVKWADFRRRAALDAQRFMPSCDSLQDAYFLPLLDGELKGEQVRSVYAMLQLKPCPDAGLDRKVVELASREEFHPADWMRWVANTADLPGMKRRSIREYLAKTEAEPRIRAMDLVRWAHVQSRNGDFSEAMESLEEAREYAPEWGIPYLKMSQLVAESGPICSFSEFDRKAVYWAAIDFCEQARNLDRRCNNFANRLLFEYRRKMPEQEEVDFRGLQVGDTYPLRCWMEMATTVK